MMDTVAPSCPLRWYFSVLWRMAELCFEDEGGVEALGHPSHSWSGASMTWRVKEAGWNQKLVEIRSTTTLKLTKRDFGFLRSSTWVLGKMQDLLRADFFPGHPGHQPVQQEDSRLRQHGNCGAGQRLRKVHVCHRLRQANLTDDQGMQMVWRLCWSLMMFDVWT